MKITINYNGAFAVFDIEPMEEPGKMVNFTRAPPSAIAELCRFYKGDSRLRELC